MNSLLLRILMCSPIVLLAACQGGNSSSGVGSGNGTALSTQHPAIQKCLAEQIPTIGLDNISLVVRFAMAIQTCQADEAETIFFAKTIGGK